MSQEDIYTSVTFNVTLENVTLNGSALNSTTNIPDTFTYTVVDNRGNALLPANTGSFSYNTSDEVWQATITAPSVAGRYHIHVSITKGSSVGFKHFTIPVKSRV